MFLAGTFATISPSFITGVNAQGETYDYGMNDRYKSYEQNYRMDNYDKKPYGNSYEQNSYSKDRDYDKSKDNRSDLIKKLKCNNINANLNNVDATFGSPADTDGGADTALAAQGGEALSTNGLMNGGGRDGERNFERENDFSFVCINNNDNTVIGDVEPISDLCEECFAINSTLQTAIEELLANFDGVGVAGVVTTDGVNEIGESITFGPQIDTIEKLCTQIETAPVSLSIDAPLSDELLRFTLSEFLSDETGSSAAFDAGIEQLIECLLERGIIVDREIPDFPASLSANGLDEDGLRDSGTVQCTGDPICARIT
jgi:hypothetical protein